MASGNLELWEKWSSSNVTLNSKEEAADVNQWLRVIKQRYLKKYQSVDNDVRETNSEEEIAAGCSFEITNLIIHNRKFWTLAFEAYEENDVNIPLLKNTVVKVMNEVKFPFQFLLTNGEKASFSIEYSFSYPSFFTANKFFED